MHVVLLGDSIFDNAAYVPGEAPVIEQLRHQLTAPTKATLLAVDGNVIADVKTQLKRLPADASHLVISVGGNDALQNQTVLTDRASNVAQGLEGFCRFRDTFRQSYRDMLSLVKQTGKPFAISTIYDRIPGLMESQRAGLALLNEAILAEASRQQLPVIDLRQICSEVTDYSSLSPIEPSAKGGLKITKVISKLAGTPASDWQRCILWA